MGKVDGEDEGSSLTASSSDDADLVRGTLTRWDRHRTLIHLSALLLYFAAGVLFVKQTEDWHLDTSLYFIVQIITTIGYGDVTVSHRASQWFMIFYVFLGVAVCANIVNDFVDRHLSAANEGAAQRLRQLEVRLSKSTHDETGAERRFGPFNRMLAAAGVYLVFVLVGTGFYSTWEACTCSYGRTHVEHCDRFNCAHTGGYMKGAREALYMSVITLSTTGFGDFAPKTHVGRVLGLIWMPLGVLSWVNFVTATLFWWRHLQESARRKRLRLRAEELPEIDEDHNGKLTLAEFRIFLLRREGLVTEEQLLHIDRFFSRLDAENKGYLSLEKLQQASELQRRLEFEYF